MHDPLIKMVAYSQARNQIHTGDLLLWSPTTFSGRAISDFAPDEQMMRCAPPWWRFSHASMAAHWLDSLVNLEMMQWAGGRVTQLSRDVRRWPGKVHVFRPTSPYSGAGAAARMIRLISTPYGWGDFGHILGRRYLPWLVRADADSPADDRPRVCSTGFAWAAHWGGGRKPCDKPDDEVTPNDLAGSDFSGYLCTLYPDAAEI